MCVYEFEMHSHMRLPEKLTLYHELNFNSKLNLKNH